MTLNWVYTPIGPPPPPPPPPNVDASLAGLTTVPVDLSATGNVTASTPQAPVDASGGSGGAGQSLALSAGGGGADSGARTQGQLTPQDYAGFRQNANEQSRQYAVMAALAPVRYPVVVGVIAFGLLNPDPAYAPTFQTAPEDRPSVLERAGETGLAVAIGAVGIKIGQAGSATHGNSLLSTRSQHVYEITQTNAAGDTEIFKYGVSGGPLNAAGLSVRAEIQVRALTRAAGGLFTYESSIVEIFPGGPGTRATALSLERNLVYQYLDLTGLKPAGNISP